MIATIIGFSIFALVIYLIVLWVTTLIEIVNHEYGGHNKIIWMGFVLFMPIMGMIFYHLFGRNQMIGCNDEDFV